MFLILKVLFISSIASIISFIITCETANAFWAMCVCAYALNTRTVRIANKTNVYLYSEDVGVLESILRSTSLVVYEYDLCEIVLLTLAIIFSPIVLCARVLVLTARLVELAILESYQTHSEFVNSVPSFIPVQITTYMFPESLF